MNQIFKTIVELLRPYIQTIWAVFSVVLIKDAQGERNTEKERANALQARNDVEEVVDAMSDDAVDSELRSDWNELRRVGVHKRKS